MKLQDDMDFTTLSWVKRELDETLKQARQALTAYVEDPSDSSQMRFCATYLHQVHGTLKMVELSGAALVVDEMEQLSQGLMSDQVRDPEEAFEVLIRGMVQLPDYLERLQSGHRDIPIVLLPLLNDLRRARGEEEFSEIALFTPKLDVSIPAKGPARQIADVKLRTAAVKLRKAYEGAFLLWLKQDDPRIVARLQQVLDKLISATTVERPRKLFWIASGVLSGIAAELLEPVRDVKLLFGRVDQVIKKLALKGEQSLDDPDLDALMQRLLFHAAQAKTGDPRVDEMRDVFSLTDLVPTEEELEHAQGSMQGHNRELLSTVTGAIKEDLMRVKDGLDLKVRKGETAEGDYGPLIETLDRVADTLGMLGLSGPRESIISEHDRLQKFAKDKSATEGSLMDVASTLLYVESSLDNYIDRLGSGKDADEPVTDLIGGDLPAAEVRRLLDSLMKESSENLQEIKRSIIEFIEAPWDFNRMAEAPRLLDEICGALLMLDLKEASDLLRGVVYFIEVELLHKQEVPDADQLDTLADAVASIEYYLEAVRENRSGRESILRVAQASLEQLGYLGDEGEQKARAVRPEEPAEKPAAEEAAEVEAPEVEEIPDSIQDSAEDDAEEPAPEPVATEQVTMRVAEASSEAAEPDISDDIDDEIREVFIEEVEEELSTLNELYPKWRSDVDDQETLTTIRRTFHTLKGSGRLVGAYTIGEFSWQIENLLNRVLDGTRGATPAVLALMDETVRALPGLLANVKGEGRPDADIEGIKSVAERLAAGEEVMISAAAADVAAPADETVEEAAADVAETESDSEDVLDADAAALADAWIAEAGEAAASRPAPEEAADAEEAADTIEEAAAEEEPEASVGEQPPELELAEDEPAIEDESDAAEMDTVSEAEESFELSLDEDTVDDDEPMEAVDIEWELDSADAASESTDEAAEPVAETDSEEISFEAADLSFEEEESEPELAAQLSLEEDQEPELDDSSSTDDDLAAGLDWGSDQAAADEDDAVEEGLDELAAALEQAAGDTDSEAESEEYTLDFDIPDEAADEMSSDDLSEAFELESETDAPVEEEVDISDSMEFLDEPEPAVDEIAASDEDEATDEPAVTEELPVEAITVEEEDPFEGSVDPVLLDILRSEVAGHLSVVKDYLASGDDRPADEPLLRAVHTLNGAIAMVDVAPLVQVTGPLERYIKRLRFLNRAPDEEGRAALTDAVRTVEGVVAELEKANPAFEHTEELSDRLAAKAEALPEPSDPSTLFPVVEESTEDAISESDSDVSMIDVSEPQTVETPVDEAPSEVEMEESAQEPADDIEPEVTDEVEQETEEEDVTEPVVEATEDESNPDDWFEAAAQAQAEEERIAREALEESDTLEAVEEEVEDESTSLAFEEFDAEEEDLTPPESLDDVQDVEAYSEAIEESKPEESFDFADEQDELVSDDSEAPEIPAVEEMDAEADAEDEDEEPTVGPAPGPIKLPEVEKQAIAFGELGDLDQELLEIFLEEGVEILDQSDRKMVEWREQPDDKGIITELQRELHTLKGGARMAGVSPVGDLSHAMESVFEAIVDNAVDLHMGHIELMEMSFDRLHRMLDQVQAQESVALGDDLVRYMESVLAGEEMALAAEAADEDQPATEEKPTTPTPAVPRKIERETALDQAAATGARPQQEIIRVRADMLDNLVNYAGEVSIYRARLEQQVGTFRFNLVEFDQTVTRLRDQLRKMEMETEAQILSRHEREKDEFDEDFDPLEMDRYSQLQQYSRALAESVADLVSIQSMLDDLTRESETLLLQQSRVNSDLQEGLMRTRMVPFDSLVPRLRRILRQTASELGKRAQLKVEGAQGEMDRTVLERVTAPLEHMLRNAIAHGLETPEDREKAGKGSEGNIRIQVSREATEVVILVSDDGAGIDHERIRQKAIERGMLKADADLSERDLFGFILQTGFSTADEVSKIAGRGVGMDVVNSEIKQLGGTLDISSKKGEGTQFTIRLPFTLAVTHAIMVRVGDVTFAIPLSSIEGVVRMKLEEFQRRMDEGEIEYTYGGETYQIQELAVLLGLDKADHIEGDMIPLLMSRVGDQRAAIRIDSVMSSREIVVKSVGPQVSSIPGIFGATILGDGSVIMILDLGPLIRRGAALQLRDEEDIVDVVETEEVEEERMPLVMVVDDSITMRKVTSRVLARHDMEVVTAKDGVDAVEQLQERIPDIMLLDIEMPRMDGFEVAGHMKSDSRLKNIPIIMITSRTGEKHRQRAMELGVNRYLGKPYQEADLLENVQDLLGITSRQ